MIKLALAFSLLFSISLFAVEEELPLTPQQKLQSIYEELYNIDYRQLSIEDFTTYTNALNDLRDMSKTTFCPQQISTTKPVVYNMDYTYNTSYSDCSAITPAIIDEKTLSFEQDALRQCYTEGYLECAVKAEARLKSIKTANGGTYGATCTLAFDIVVSATK